jgi:ubiquinone biosynthesis protein UbiJ
MRLDPDAIPEAIARRLLHRETWARQRLSAHGGRVFVIAVGPAATALAIDASGMVESTTLAGRAPDLTLTLSPLQLPGFLADPANWDRCVKAAGDPALAATLRELAQTLPWFVEQAFGSALGAIVGRRAAETGRRLLAFPDYAAQRIGESVVRYARDEAGLCARSDEAILFAEQAAVLAARVDALATRLDLLESRLAAPALRPRPPKRERA